MRFSIKSQKINYMYAKNTRTSAKREIQTEGSAKRDDQTARPRRAQIYKQKNLPASRAHSHCALSAQLASLASLSAPRARDSIVALRAP